MLRRIRPHAKMDLRLSWRGKDRCVYLWETLVNAQNALLDLRFAQPRDANLAVEHAHAGNTAFQPRQNLFAEERLQFAGRAGEQHDGMPGVLEPQARRGAPRIFEDFSSFWNHRLTHVYLGHFAAQRAEASFDVAKNCVVAFQLASEKFGDGLARKIVFRGAEAA